MGGGVIRPASWLSGISAVRSVLRSSPAVPLAEQSLRTPSLNVSSVIVSSQNPSDLTPAATVEKPPWGVDEWDLAGDSEVWEGSWSSGDPLPRVVFSGVPSYDEAKEATAELKDALEKVYLSSNNSETDDSTLAGQFSGLSLISNSCSKSKATSASEAVAAYTKPSRAVQAFKLLSQSPAAQEKCQSMTASVVSDPNVWNALWQNKAFQDILSLQKASSKFPSEASDEVACVKDGELAKRFEEVFDDILSQKNSNESFLKILEHSILSVLQNIKICVIEMVSNISSFLHNIFRVPGADKNTVDDANSGSASVEETLVVSLMGLVVMVVMVILLKRV